VATLESEFLSFSISKLEELTNRIEVCIAKLTPEQVWTRGSEEQNAAGNLLLHLNGNVRQWIVSGLGGAADRRQRDLEFSERATLPPAELVSRLRETVSEAIAVLRNLTAEQLLDPVRIQDYDGTKLTAIYHVVEHFAGHAFQIFLLTKFFTGKDLAFYAHLSGAKTAPAPGTAP
jgi:Protein of unknown function (DUF1572)